MTYVCIIVIIQGGDPEAQRMADLIRDLSEEDDGEYGRGMVGVTDNLCSSFHTHTHSHHNPHPDNIQIRVALSATAAGPLGVQPRDHHADDDDDVKGTVMTASSSSGQEAASGAVAALGSSQLQTLLLRLIRGGLSTKGAAKEAARLVPGLGRKEAYAMALELASASKREGKIVGT